MALNSVAAFVAAIMQSRVLAPAQTTMLFDLLVARFSDPLALAWHLFDLGWLTTYQINQLAQGHNPELVLGDYLLLERLGQGSIGRVYKAQRAGGQATVALKVLRPELLANAEAVRQFEWEIQVLSRLDHANIVKTLDADQASSRHFFAMEFVEGTHLEKWVQQTGPLPFSQACAYLRQAANGLQHAHQSFFVHHDIKPANLFLVFPADQRDRADSASWDSLEFTTEAQLKILDWGLASWHDPAHRHADLAPLLPNEAFGTADYLSPEQAHDPRSADIRADIYSLGCTLYFLLAAQPPFPGGSIMRKLLHHQQTEPTPLQVFRPDLPVALQAVVQKMMAKRPEDRFAAPAEVAAALLPFNDSAAAPRKDLSQAKGADRRTFVRHGCHLESNIRSIVSSTGIAWPAEMLDISKGGLGLLINRRFEPGALLDLELQTATPHAHQALMVRVVNVRSQGDGTWILGCAFTHDLNDEDLWALRVERLQPPSPETRAWFRLPCSVSKVQASAPDSAREPAPAKVLNIAAGGAALHVRQQVEGGTLLRLELQGSPNEPPLLIAARVIHSTAQANGDWVLGCSFTSELTQEELQTLL